MDNTALFKLGYGLYVLTTRDDGRDNGCVVNTAMQVTSGANPVGVVTVNKQNHTHGMVMRSRVLNISTLTTRAPFALFERFGYQSGANVDKFAGFEDAARTPNGVLYLTRHANAVLSFEVVETLDFGTHTMFKANIVDARVFCDDESLTYAHYQQHIKPRPQPAAG
ncbi:MAG: flavin reductase family protein, partial [Kiritimatiellaeota bacterium]|nr:flavin reductase family protein [Kiritimatiellota bacterium]